MAYITKSLQLSTNPTMHRHLTKLRANEKPIRIFKNEGYMRHTKPILYYFKNQTYMIFIQIICCGTFREHVIDTIITNAIKEIILN